MGLFDGKPNVSSSQTMQTTEVPTWMQDAIYNQIQWSQNLANKDYQPYSPEPEFIEEEARKRIAGFSPTRTQAYANTVANQGSWSPAMAAAQSGMAGFTTKGTADDFRTAQADYLRKDMVDKGLNAGQDLYGRAAGMDIVGAAQPALNKALGMDAFSAGSPLINQAGAQNIIGAAQPALNRALGMDAYSAGSPLINQSGAQNIVGAAQPYLSQAGTTTAQALADRALAAANPYLQASAQTAPSQISNYMSPYQGGVLDVLAKQGARQLGEKFLPEVSDQFIKAGQFGSSRMGEFGSRALRDMQEGVLNKQGDLLNQGYNQAMIAAQADLTRQGQLASTVGSISGADLSRILQGGGQYGNLAQTAGGLTAQQASSQLGAGNALGNLTSTQMQNLANIGNTQGQLTAQQASSQLGAGNALGNLTSTQMQNLANIGNTQGQLTGQQMQNLGALGQYQTRAGEAQQQFGLAAAQQAQTAQAQDYARQIGALQNTAEMAKMEQGMRASDVAALEAVGVAQQGQEQKNLDAAYAAHEAEQLYGKQNLDWLNTQVRGMAPITPQTLTVNRTGSGDTYGASPLMQIAGAGALYNAFSGQPRLGYKATN